MRRRVAAICTPVAAAMVAGIAVHPHSHHGHRTAHVAARHRDGVPDQPRAVPTWATLEDAIETQAPPAPPAAAPQPVPPPSPPAPPSPAQAAAAEVPAAVMAEWAMVNECEEGGNWHVVGDHAQGGLGITVANWAVYGGQRDFGPEWAATPAEQVVVAQRIEGGSGYVPDQGGCTGAW